VVDCETVDRLGELVGPPKRDEQAFDIVVDQRAQMRSAPADDR
jgi:hypothetical protein